MGKNPKKMSGDDQQFCLRWNDFQTNMVASFKHLRDEKSFCDVTIATEGQHTKAHKVILCACSPYFKNLLEQNPAKHPIIILKDVPFMHLTAILEFMYAGEVNEAQDQGIGRGRPGQGRRYDGLIRARTVVNKDLE